MEERANDLTAVSVDIELAREYLVALLFAILAIVLFLTRVNSGMLRKVAPLIRGYENRRTKITVVTIGTYYSIRAFAITLRRHNRWVTFLAMCAAIITATYGFGIDKVKRIPGNDIGADWVVDVSWVSVGTIGFLILWKMYDYFAHVRRMEKVLVQLK